MLTRSYDYRPVNAFGFNTGEDPDTQCQALLHLTNDDKKWKDIRARIIHLTHSKLSRLKMGSCQDPEIFSIIQMITEEFKDLFPEDVCKENRRHYLRQWILNMHRGRRRNDERRRRALKQSQNAESQSVNLNLIQSNTTEKINPILRVQPNGTVEVSRSAARVHFDSNPAPVSSDNCNLPTAVASTIETLVSKTNLPEPIVPPGVNTSHAKTNANLLPLRRMMLGHQTITRPGTSAAAGSLNIETHVTSPVALAYANTIDTSCDTIIEANAPLVNMDLVVTACASGSHGPDSEAPADNLNPTPSAPETRAPYRRFRPATSSTSQSNEGHHSSTFLQQSLAIIGNTSTSTAIHNINQHTLLLNFLKICNPPMDHYYHLFVKAGCMSYQCLFAMSTWPKETRRNFLASLGTGTRDGDLGSASKPTEMDVLVIDRLFEVVFGLDKDE